MRRWGLPIFLVVVVAALVLLRGCDDERAVEQAVRGIAFTPDGTLRMQLARSVETIEVMDATGRVVATTHPHGLLNAEVFFQWQPGATYRVAADAGPPLPVVAPRERPLFVVRLHAPLGQTPHAVYVTSTDSPPSPPPFALPVDEGENIDVMLEVEQLRDGAPLDIRVSMRSSMGGKPPGDLFEPYWQEEPASLAFEFDKAIWTTRLVAQDAAPRGAVTIEIAGEGFLLPLEVRFVPARLGAEQIEVVGWDLPTDPSGAFRPDRPPDQVGLPNPVWDRLSAWFGFRPHAVDYLKPYAYQTLRLRNHSSRPVSLMVRSGVVAEGSGEAVPYFEPPRWDARGGILDTSAFVEVGPNETVPCVLPIHIRSDTPSGSFVRRAEIVPLGSDKALLSLDARLGVTRSRPFLTIWVLFVVGVSCAWLLLFLLFYRRLVTRLGVRALVLLSLLGALQFCLQIAGGWLSSVFYAVLGPFNCFVGGFLTEVLTYLLVTCILLLVPRVGAMTLAGVVSYLMGAVLFGSFGLTDLLFVGSSIAFREVMLFTFGVTRGARHPDRPPRLVQMMLALGIADAASAFTSLCLMSVFYRLFYAHWYIALNVGITGFLYTCIGVWLGRRLGLGLRKVRA